MHMIANHQIDFLDDSHAYGLCYVRAIIGTGDNWSEVAACYVDDYVKRDDRWYFSRRRPTDLQLFAVTNKPMGLDAKLTLSDAFRVHQERRAEIRVARAGG